MSVSSVAASAVAEPAVHPGLAELAATFAHAAIRWAVLRVPDGGFSAPCGDIDLFVHRDDRGRAARTLTELRFVHLIRPGADAHFIRYFADSDSWIWLHVAARIRLGGSEVPVDALLPSATSMHAGTIPIVPHEARFWLLLWHCLADKGRVPAHHRASLVASAPYARPQGELGRRFAAGAGDPKASQVLRDAVNRRDWAAVDAAAVRPSRGTWRQRVSGAMRRLGRRAETAWRGRHLPGLTVAILGPDGAGKTTLVQSLTATVRLPSRTIYMGLTGGALRHARRLRMPPLTFVASAAVIWTRYLRGRYHRARGRLVLFDRYIFDAVAPHPHRLPRWQQRERAWLGRICPGPDLVLFLDAPGMVMFARKHAYDAATLEEWRRHFRTLALRLSQFAAIDATRSPDCVRADATARIWERYVSRTDPSRPRRIVP